jgi:hypothetical protein
MLCRRVQVEEPRDSTSGGQFDRSGEGESVGIEEVAGNVLFVKVEEEEEVVAVAGEVDFRIIAIHAEEDVQLRQLCDF